MITLRSNGYSMQEFANLQSVIKTACENVRSIEGCTDDNAHCPICVNRHLCGDMYKFAGYLENMVTNNRLL